MVTLRALCFAAAAPLAAAASGEFCPPFVAQCCHISANDPSYATFKGDEQYQVPGWAEVDLDLPPAQRWAHVVQPKADQIRAMITQFKSLLGFVSREIFALMEKSDTVKKLTADVLDAMGDYGEEIRGMANATGILDEELLVYNMMYEIEGGCTSIVAQDPQGNVVHGRNLDFGLLFGEDVRHLQWTLTELLRPLLTNVRFKKGGNVVFNSTVFLGYVGLITGAKQGGFSFSVNTRYDSSRWAGLLEYLKGTNRDGQWLTFLMREAMLNNATFDDALTTVRQAKLLGPAYVILGGVSQGQGAIVARSAQGVVQEWLLADAAKNGSNFIVQANWDNPSDPWYDNRRSPAEHCLKDNYNDHIDFEGMFKVLSAHPNRNRLTTYTALMRAQTGDYESYLQFCNEMECAPWMAGNLKSAAMMV